MVTFEYKTWSGKTVKIQIPSLRKIQVIVETKTTATLTVVV
jgi:hypothetical protein